MAFFTPDNNRRRTSHAKAEERWEIEWRQLQHNVKCELLLIYRSMQFLNRTYKCNRMNIAMIWRALSKYDPAHLTKNDREHIKEYKDGIEYLKSRNRLIYRILKRNHVKATSLWPNLRYEVLNHLSEKYYVVRPRPRLSLRNRKKWKLVVTYKE